MHPARQIRLGASLLILLAALSAPVAARPQAPGTERPEPPRPSSDNKKEARKRPPLAVRVEWTATLPAVPTGGAGYDAARAYVPLQSGELTAVSLDGGAVAWRTQADATGPPVAGDGLVFVPTAGAIEARDAETGEARWTFALEAPLSAPLAWQNGWLFAGTTGATGIMLRAATGEPLWRRALPANARAAAALTGDRLYVPLENRHVMALTLAAGETIWDRALGGRPTTLAPLDDRVFVGADDKFFYCLSWKNGKVAWRWRTGGPIVGTPAIDEDHVYFVSLDNLLRALNRGNGHQVWRAGIPFRPAAGPFLAGGLLVVAGLAEIRAYQPVDGSDAGSAPVPEVLAGPPHFLAAGGQDPSPFVIVTREAQLRLFVPEGPPLPSKPFPAKPVYPLWPGMEEGE